MKKAAEDFDNPWKEILVKKFHLLIIIRVRKMGNSGRVAIRHRQDTGL